MLQVMRLSTADHSSQKSQISRIQADASRGDECGVLHIATALFQQKSATSAPMFGDLPRNHGGQPLRQAFDPSPDL